MDQSRAAGDTAARSLAPGRASPEPGRPAPRLPPAAGAKDAAGPDACPSGEGIVRMLAAAEHFLACQDRSRALAAWAAPPPRSLAEAIERDFAGFDLVQAEAGFRAALAALSGGSDGRPASADWHLSAPQASAGWTPAAPEPPPGSGDATLRR